MNDLRAQTDDPIVLGYHTSELKIAAEFLSNWLPFLTKDLCHNCTQTISDRVGSLDPVAGGDFDGIVELSGEAKPSPSPSPSEKKFACSSPNHQEFHEEFNDNHDNCDTHSLGSWKDGANGCSEPVLDVSTSGATCHSATVDAPSVRMSWADMAQEDELKKEEDEEEVKKQYWVDEPHRAEVGMALKVPQKPTLSRDHREYFRFKNVQTKKDFICLERIKGKIVNILDGLELHTGVFSAADQKRIVDFIYDLQEMGRKGELKERTYSAPQKWMKGKGHVTIQFGCCYNYATDKKGNLPGIIRNELVDPIPPLFKVIIKKLVGWHVLPPSCVPDSCIVNIYEEGDCIPPHVDSHDFVRPFCTVSFLSECNIVFGSTLQTVGPGVFSGATEISLPVGSVLVLNGNGADVTKHCVPAVPSKRISITFRKMDEAKRPVGFVPESDLQGLQPLPYDLDESNRFNSSNSQRQMNRHSVVREGNSEMEQGFAERGTHSEPHYSIRTRPRPANRRRDRLSMGT
ncbi:hypothetical protein HHK36_026381 [Tetracentron sinense]|uniref:Fe2OG dioxygenase domain-containing protein n=1 Tax=Tetracentron sinense TaxID=13715 RepID=A0A834YKA1_TETSI|nr:hypothetical protein HHK36_026381 [Tetracentron sinense]